MAVREYGARSLRWRLGGAQWGPFEGGLNLRDSYTEIAPSEFAAATNLTLDERGVATKRNASPTTAALAAASTPPGAVSVFFYSVTLNLFICQVGATLYKAAPGAATWTSFRNQSTSDPTAIADFPGAINYVHPVDGARFYDGATEGSSSPTVKGTAIAVWQNKLWATGDPGNPSRVYYSGLGPTGGWTPGTDFVDLREKDNKPTTCVFGGSGLLVFKEDSAYRINDSTQGAYQTIDWTTGSIGARAICGQDGRIFVWSADGLYQGNGLAPFENVGDRLRPRFLSANVNATTKPMISAASASGRVYFACPSVSATVPDSILEYNPRVGWIAEHYLNAQVGPFAKYSTAGVPAVSFASGSATIKDLFTSTTRTGFSASLTTGYVEPFGGRLGRLTRLTPQVFGTAGTAMTITVNYIAISGAPATWTSSFTLSSASGVQRPVLQPKIQGSAFQVAISDPNNIAAFSVEAIDADFVLSSLR
jgi:hypothetical protein